MLVIRTYDAGDCKTQDLKCPKCNLRRSTLTQFFADPHLSGWKAREILRKGAEIELGRVGQNGHH